MKGFYKCIPFCILLGVVLLTVGMNCSNYMVENQLPTGAERVLTYDKGWCTFDMPIGSRKFRFLYRQQTHSQTLVLVHEIYSETEE